MTETNKTTARGPDIAALKRVRRALKWLPRHKARYTQRVALVDESAGKGGHCLACVAGVAIAELRFGGNYTAANKAVIREDDAYWNDEAPDGPTMIIANRLGLDENQARYLFGLVEHVSDGTNYCHYRRPDRHDAAAAVQCLIDNPGCVDPWSELRARREAFRTEWHGYRRLLMQQLGGAA